MPTLTKRRALGFIETRMALLHGVHAGTGQVTSIVHLEGDLSFASLVRAAEATFARFPLLRCRIEADGPNLSFSSHDDFTRVSAVKLERKSEEHWRAVALEELNRPLDLSHSLWRYVLLSDSSNKHELLLTRAHSISDGASTLEMLRFWLSELAHPTETIFCENPSPSIDTWIGTAGLAELSPKKDDLQAGCHWFDLTSTQSKKLEVTAHAHGLSAHTLLSALFLQACRFAELSENFDLGVAISRRPKISSGAQLEGCQIGVVQVPNLAANLPLLDLAATYSEILKRQKEKMSRERSSAECEQLVSALSQNSPETARYAVGITDLGKISLPSPSEKIIVKGFRTSAARRSRHPALTLHALRENGIFRLALTFPRPGIKDTQVNTIAQILRESS